MAGGAGGRAPLLYITLSVTIIEDPTTAAGPMLGRFFPSLQEAAPEFCDRLCSCVLTSIFLHLMPIFLKIPKHPLKLLLIYIAVYTTSHGFRPPP